MRLGVDLLFLLPGATGGRETYARELLGAIRRTRPEVEVTTFLNRETAAAGRGWWSEEADRALVLPRASGAARARWAAGELAGVARAAARAEVDVLHSPANFAPLGGPFGRVLTLHDVLWRSLPELMPAPLRWATEAMIAPAARRADRVVTVSEHSREEIVAALGIAPERVVAIPNGLAPPPDPPGDADRARAALEAGARPVALAVATDLPHKNLAALVAAQAELDPARRPLLAIAGHGTDAGALPPLAASLGVVDDVRLLGAVSAELLEDLYAAAAVLVTATRYEGFGLPLLEAMARGVPVVASDLPVLREVAGDDGAAWVDEDSPQSIAAGIAAVLDGGATAERLRAAGRERAAQFSWERAAEQTLAVLEQVAGRHGASGEGR